MGFRFFRRMTIAPGVRLNFSKRGVSPSFGVRGARVTLGRQGVRKTVGIPGTGLFYTQVGEKKSGRKRTSRQAGTSPPPPEPQHKLDLGFFGRMFTPADERAFVDGCKAYVEGNTKKAFTELRGATNLADGAFLAGFLALDAKKLDEAERHLREAASMHRSLGQHFKKYGLDVRLSLAVTPEVIAHVSPCKRGTLLGLAEVYQLQGRIKEAIDGLKQIRRETPDDVVVNLSLAELVQEAAPNDRRLAKQIVKLAGNVQNDSPTHAALMLYKARALRKLGLATAARDELTAALRKKKDRDEELLRSLRYERACVYEDLGQKARARREFESLYAEAPGYEDVATRLGL